MNKLQVIESEAADELDQLKTRISDYDREFHSAFTRQMGFAFLAGAALNRAKEIIPHGKFMEWSETELSVKRSSVARYMKFAEAIGKLPTVGNLKEVKLLGEGELLTPAQQKKITEAVHSLADGKTLTEMYRDLGIIRQPEKPKHHPAKPLTAAEELAEHKAHAKDLLSACIGPMRVLVGDLDDVGEFIEHLTDADWEEALSVGVRFTSLCRAHLKGKGAK